MYYLHVTDLTDQFEAEEVGEYLRDMVDHRSNAEQGGCAAVILQVPEQEGEDQADTETHEPGDEEERGALQIFELLQHGHPFWDLPHRLSEHFCLKR